MKANIRKFISFLYIINLLNSCTMSDTSLNSIDNSNQIKTNHPPISATLIFESDTVLINKSVCITCIVEDLDENENFSFEWTSFKVTENSTDDVYVFDYWKNRGEFLQDGVNTFWTPAMAEGKYIIFCIAKDKGGAEIFTSKIINAKVGFGFTLVTDTLLYYTNGTSDQNNLLSYTLTNHSEIIFCVNACGLPVKSIEKKESDKWNSYAPITYWCRADIDPYGPFGPNGKLTENLIIPPDPGIYRLTVPYGIYPKRSWDKILYSGEFEVVLR